MSGSPHSRTSLPWGTTLMDLSDIKAFAFVFRGSLKKAYGKYSISGAEKDSGKKIGKAETVRENIRLQLFEDHLTGKQSLGLVPINETTCVEWAAIDIDDYDLDHADFHAQLLQYRIPAVPCRSKSGGAHLYFFFAEPVSAELVRDKLAKVAAALGHGGCEIFPKQTALDVARGDVGNWINLPYFDSQYTTRYASNPKDGDSLDLKQFIERSEQIRITADQLDRLKVPGDRPKTPTKRGQHAAGSSALPKDGARGEDAFIGAPPCLEILAETGFPSGTRNKGFFNVGVYLKKRFPNDWPALLSVYNETSKSTLPGKEIQALSYSLGKKEYFYTCKEEPCVSHCNAKLCKTRRFGISEADTFPEIIAVAKIATDPVQWFVRLEGFEDKSLVLTTEDVQKFDRFQRAALEQLSLMLPLLSPKLWNEILVTVFDTAKIQTIEPAVGDRLASGTTGYFWGLLREFVLDREIKEEDTEALLAGEPVRLNEKIWFRAKDFYSFLERSNFRFYTQAQAFALLERNTHITKDRITVPDGQRVRVLGADISFFENMEETHRDMMDPNDARVSA